MTDWHKYLLMIIKKFWLVIITIAVFVSIASYVTFQMIKPQYQADTKLFVLINNHNDNNRVFYDDVMASEVLAKNYQGLITSRSITSEVIQKLHLSGMTDDLLAKRISVQLIPDSSMLLLSVRYEDPMVAANIANELSNVFIQETSELLKMNNVSLVDKAVVSQKPVYPRPGLVISFSFLAGLAISLGVILGIAYFDDTAGNSEEIQQRTGLPVVGIIPDMKIR